MALSGLPTVIGDPDRPPLRLPGEQAYALTGIQVATAALMGLHARRRTGQGQRIDVSATQSAALANYRGPVMSEWTGRVGRREGNRLVRGKSGVRQVWPCADGFVTWSMIDNPNMMRALVRVMEAEGAAGELSLIDWDAILVADTDQAVIDRWQQVVADFFAAHTREALGAWSLQHGWGLSPIARLEEVRDSDHLAARGLFVDVTDGQGTHRLPGPLFHHGGAPGAPARSVPK
jgi:crotonobetainyl-CoA:carnitine CoA-transferase CaiB-like acyl-CoA transferase